MTIHSPPFTEETGPKFLLGPPTNDLQKAKIQGPREAKFELDPQKEGFC